MTMTNLAGLSCASQLPGLGRLHDFPRPFWLTLIVRIYIYICLAVSSSRICRFFGLANSWKCSHNSYQDNYDTGYLSWKMKCIFPNILACSSVPDYALNKGFKQRCSNILLLMRRGPLEHLLEIAESNIKKKASWAISNVTSSRTYDYIKYQPHHIFHI